MSQLTITMYVLPVPVTRPRINAYIEERGLGLPEANVKCKLQKQLRKELTVSLRINGYTAICRAYVYDILLPEVVVKLS